MLAPDMDEGRIDAALEIAQFLGQYGLTRTRDRYGSERIANIHISRNSARLPSCTIHDSESDMYIKSYKHTVDAELQYRTMNVLYRRLARQDVGVRAVRHLAVLENGQMRPTAVIEPAVGESVQRSVCTYMERRVLAKDIAGRLDMVLGSVTRRILINDIERSTNMAGNLNRDDAGVYHLYDQPFIYRDARYLRMRAALQWLEMTTPE